MTVFALLPVTACIGIAASPTVRVPDFLDAPGAMSDAAIPINAAIAALPTEGGTVILPARSAPYEIRSAISIRRDDVILDGTGATIRFADNAMKGDVIDCIELVGTPDDPVEDITIRGLRIDGNYWAQPGSYNPRGIDTDHATRVLVEGVTITNAFVGLTFGLGVTNAEAHNTIITNWYDDGFNVSGDGTTGGASHIRFVRCVAKDSPDEIAGGPPGRRNNAWEIEDGATDIELIECTVENVGGNGFAVRNHPTSQPLTTTRVRFVRCRATNVAGNGFSIFGYRYPCTVEDISIEACETDSSAVIYKDVRGLRIADSLFDGTVTLGPVRDAVLERSRINWLRVWSSTVEGGELPQGYDTAVELIDCRIANPVSVFGNQTRVKVVNPNANQAERQGNESG